MGKSSAPPAPDYSAAARETAAGNKEAAQFAVNANRINQVTPYGSLTYSKAPRAFDQAGYDKAMAEWQNKPNVSQNNSPFEWADDGFLRNDAASGSGGQGGIAPTREQFMAPDDGGGWTQTMTLTPQAQATLDKQMRLSDQYADTASKGFANVQGLLENPNIDMSGIPEMRGIDMSQLSGVRQLNPMMSGGGQQRAAQMPGNNMMGRPQGGLDKSHVIGPGHPMYGRTGATTPEELARMAASSAPQSQLLSDYKSQMQQRGGLGAQQDQDGIRALNSDMSGVRSLNSDMSGLRNFSSDMSGVRGLNSDMSGVRNLSTNNLNAIRNLNTEGMTNVRGIDLNQLGGVRGLDTSGLTDVRRLGAIGLPQAPINAGQTAQQAILSRLNPTLSRDEEALRTRLANQGIALGSSAYNREMELAGQRANDLRLQAAAQGISLDQAARQQAFGENQAMSNFDLGLNQQQFGQRQAMSNFDAARRAQALGEQQTANQADMAMNQQQFGQRQAMTAADMAQRGQMFGENQAMTAADLARNQQQFGQNQTITNADLARNQQQFGQNQALANFDLSRNQQQFGQNQAVTAADLARNQQQFGQNQALTTTDLARNQQAFGQNQAASLFDISRRNQQFNEQQNLAALSGNQRNQALQEAFARQSRPLDLVSALRSGSQVQNPQFQNFAQQATVAGPDILNATNQMYGQQVAAANAENAAFGGLMSGLGGLALGGAKMGLFGRG
jgi:hypothetical protein